MHFVQSLTEKRCPWQFFLLIHDFEDGILNEVHLKTALLDSISVSVRDFTRSLLFFKDIAIIPVLYLSFYDNYVMKELRCRAHEYVEFALLSVN